MLGLMWCNRDPKPLLLCRGNSSGAVLVKRGCRKVHSTGCREVGCRAVSLQVT